MKFEGLKNTLLRDILGLWFEKCTDKKKLGASETLKIIIIVKV